MTLRAHGLLGRDAELETLDAALDAAGRGRGALVRIAGEPGIGKSALLQALSARAEARGFSVWSGRAWEFADAPPLFPLRRGLQMLGVDPAQHAAAGDGSAFVLWEQVLEALARTGRATPLLWTVEDAHAADLQSLDLLAFLAQPLRALRVVVAVTTRLEDPRLSERMLERLHRMARDGLDLRLPRLPAAEVRALAQELSGAEISDALSARLEELSAGNPLFVVEYAHALRAARGHPGALGAVPATLRHVVLERARLLSEPSQRALEACAVLGRESSAALAARTLGLLPAQVIDRLLPALRAGLLTETEPGQFRFSHVLVRDALYEATAPSERAALHAAVAAALGAGDDSLDARVARAHHALLGLSVRQDAQLPELLERTVRGLGEGGAHDRACALDRRILDARSAGLLPPASLEQLLESAERAQLAGRYAESRALCEQVIERARSAGDASAQARAALRLGAFLQPGHVDRTLVKALHDADLALDGRDPKLACLVAARYAAALQPAEDPQQPVALARAAIARARALGDPATLCEVLFLAGSALVDYAPVGECIACARELLELAQHRGDHGRALQACIRLAMDHVKLGDFAALAREVERALSLSDVLGRAPRHRWRPLLLQSMQAATRGDFAESERCQVEVAQLGSYCDDPALGTTLFVHRTLVAQLQRRDAEMRAAVAAMEQAGGRALHSSGLVHAVRAQLLSRAEDTAAVADLIVLRRPHDGRLRAEPDFALLLGEATALAGSDAERRELRETLLGLGLAHVSLGHVPLMYDGPVVRLVGLLDAALGDTEVGLARLREALALVTANHHRPWQAQLHYELGKVLLQAGRQAEALPELRAGLALAEALAMPGLIAALRARLEGSLDSAAASPPAPQAVQPAARPVLLREGDDWVLHHGPRTLRLRDARGVRLLACLMERPGEELHVLALSGDDTGSLGESDAGEHLDETARKAYRARLAELDADIDAAEGDADLGRLPALRREREQLLQELSRAVGLGGRARKAGSATERARVSVQKRLKDTLGRIGEQDPALGQYLGVAIRTGTFCSFRP